MSQVQEEHVARALRERYTTADNAVLSYVASLIATEHAADVADVAPLIAPHLIDAGCEENADDVDDEVFSRLQRKRKLKK